MINEVVKDLEQVATYLDDMIGFDSDPTTDVKTIRALFGDCANTTWSSPPRRSIWAPLMRKFWGPTFRPRVCVHTRKKCQLPMPRNLKKVLAQMGGVKSYIKFLRDLSSAYVLSPPSSGRGQSHFTPAMEVTVREILAGIAAPPILVLPWLGFRSRRLPSLPRVLRRLY